MTTLDELLYQEDIDFEPIEERLWQEIGEALEAGTVLVVGLGTRHRNVARAMAGDGDAIPAGQDVYYLTRKGLRKLQGLPLDPSAVQTGPDEIARRIGLLYHSGFLAQDLTLISVPEPRGPSGP